MIVLVYLIKVVTFLIIENDAENTEENSLGNFEDDIQRLSKLVKPVSLENCGELSAPACLYFLIDFNTFVKIWFVDFIILTLI